MKIFSRNLQNGILSACLPVGKEVEGLMGNTLHETLCVPCGLLCGKKNKTSKFLKESRKEHQKGLKD